MDILSFGMKMELDGKKYYLEQADKLQDLHAQTILRFLADEEQKHYDFIKNYKEGSRDLPESHLVRDVKNVFEQMIANNQTFVTEKSTMFDVLNKGLEMEDKSIEFYNERAAESNTPDDRDIFIFLKKQEEKHYSLLSSLIEFYEQPHHWLENAEFTHLDDY